MSRIRSFNSLEANLQATHLGLIAREELLSLACGKASCVLSDNIWLKAYRAVCV